MSRDPPNIGHATELIIGMDIKNVFDSQGGTEKISSGRVNDALGFTSRSRGLAFAISYLGVYEEIEHLHKE